MNTVSASAAPLLRRAAAFGIDVGLVVLVLLAMLYGAFPIVARSGAAGPVIGLSIALAYCFATQQPSPRRRPAGQRALGLAEVPATPFPRGRLRAFLGPLLLVLPPILLRLWDVRELADLVASPWRWTAVTMSLSALLANLLLAIVPNGGGRLLHNRLLGTRIVVAPGSADASMCADRLMPWFWGTLVGLPALVLGALVFGLPRPTDLPPMDAGGWQDESPASAFGAVDRVIFRFQWDAASRVSRTAEVRVSMPTLPEDPAATAGAIAKALAARRHSLAGALAMQVEFESHADLGIVWSDRQRTVTVTPAEWQAASLPMPWVALSSTGPDPAVRPQGEVPHAGTSPAERAQGAASLRLARPMLHALQSYWREQRAVPPPEALEADPDLHAREQDGIRIEATATGTLEVRFVSGALAPFSYAWVPQARTSGTFWLCAHPHIPSADLGGDCP